MPNGCRISLPAPPDSSPCGRRPDLVTPKATGPAIRARATLLDGEQARVAACALARRHRVLQAILVPTAHRLMRYRTLHYELVPR